LLHATNANIKKIVGIDIDNALLIKDSFVQPNGEVLIFNFKTFILHIINVLNKLSFIFFYINRSIQVLIINLLSTFLPVPDKNPACEHGTAIGVFFLALNSACTNRSAAEVDGVKTP